MFTNEFSVQSPAKGLMLDGRTSRRGKALSYSWKNWAPHRCVPVLLFSPTFILLSPLERPVCAKAFHCYGGEGTPVREPPSLCEAVLSMSKTLYVLCRCRRELLSWFGTVGVAAYPTA